MSQEAFTWAWTTRVGDAGRKALLMGLGGYAHRNGRHAFPSRKTLAEYAECSVKTIDRALTELIRDGFIRRGDQTLVQHLRADRRPVVYDLAMDDTTRAAWKEAHERGDNLSPRDVDPELEDTDDRPEPRGDNLSPRSRSAVSPRTDPHGATNPAPRGDTAVTPEVTTNNNTPDPHTGCHRHLGQPHSSCRACGTSPRASTVAAATARRAAANAAAIQADRTAIGQRATDEQRARHAAEARELIHAGRSRA